jgi:hypothetical protein
MRPRWGSKPRLTDRLIVGRNMTLTLTVRAALSGSLKRTVELQLRVRSEGTRLARNGRQPARTSARNKRNVHRWKPLPNNVAEGSRGLRLKSDSGQLNGVCCSKVAPARTEAAEHGK